MHGMHWWCSSVYAGSSGLDTTMQGPDAVANIVDCGVINYLSLPPPLSLSMCVGEI